TQQSELNPHKSQTKRALQHSTSPSLPLNIIKQHQFSANLRQQSAAFATQWQKHPRPNPRVKFPQAQDPTHPTPDSNPHKHLQYKEIRANQRSPSAMPKAADISVCVKINHNPERSEAHNIQHPSTPNSTFNHPHSKLSLIQHSTFNIIPNSIFNIQHSPLLKGRRPFILLTGGARHPRFSIPSDINPGGIAPHILNLPPPSNFTTRSVVNLMSKILVFYHHHPNLPPAPW
ncbi:MAG: hypothetical protein Q4C37_06810, partial [Bacteroidales bacterium]|nr:hypothetical protein [Bacteroidales bacterium]